MLKIKSMALRRKRKRRGSLMTSRVKKLSNKVALAAAIQTLAPLLTSSHLKKKDERIFRPEAMFARRRRAQVKRPASSSLGLHAGADV